MEISGGVNLIYKPLGETSQQASLSLSLFVSEGLRRPSRDEREEDDAAKG